MSCIAGARGRRALTGIPALLSVLANAPAENSVSRMFAEAKKPFEHPDRDRKNSFEPSIYLAAEQPTHYDFVIHTELLGVEHATALIAAAAE